MLKKTLACAILATTSHAALAANNVELKVSGNIAPVACDVNIGNGGTIDYGNISPDLLKVAAITKLAEKNLPLEISCEAPIKFGLKSTTRRPNTGFGGVSYPNGANEFTEAAMMNQINFHGLGKADNGEKIGGYAMVIDDNANIADGKKVFSIGKHPNDSQWNDSKYGRMIHSYQWIISWSDKAKSDPTPIKTLNTNLRIQAYIAYKEKLDITKPIKLDGMSSIELVYL